jgi:hypothetical protein
MKFTFKTQKSTGRYRSFFPPSYYIKLNKIECGLIVGSNNYCDIPPYKIRLQVIKSDIMEDGNPNCDWKWITLKKESSSIQEAKDFLNDHFESINSKYKILNHD